MIDQNARFFKRRKRRAWGVGGQLSESDGDGGDDPDGPDDRGDGPPGGGPPGGGPPGGGPPCVKLLAGVPRRLRRKHVRRARAFLDWQRRGGGDRDPPDGPTPLTPAIRRKSVPASAEIEPKRPRRATGEAGLKWRPRPANDDVDAPTKKKRDVCPAGTFTGGADANEGPRPRRDDRRAQWEADGGEPGRVALPWVTTERGDAGGEGGEASVPALKKATRDAVTGAVAKRPQRLRPLRPPSYDLPRYTGDLLRTKATSGRALRVARATRRVWRRGRGDEVPH